MRTKLSTLEENILESSAFMPGVKNRLKNIWLEQTEINDTLITTEKLFLALLPSLVIGLLRLSFIPSLFWDIKWNLSNLSVGQQICGLVILICYVYGWIRTSTTASKLLTQASEATDEFVNPLLQAKCIVRIAKKELVEKHYLEKAKLIRIFGIIVAIIYIVGIIVMFASGAWLLLLVLEIISIFVSRSNKELDDKINYAVHELSKGMNWSELYNLKD